jgi:hypothetical protein
VLAGLAAVIVLLACASAQARGSAPAGFTQQGSKLTASDEAKVTTPGIAGGQFGHSVALSADGSTAIVGAYNNSNGYGAAWVYTRSGSTWKQDGHKLAASGNVGEAHFGDSVALSADGKTALIGGSQFGGGLGAVWVFTRSGSGWTQATRIVGPGPVGAQAFGVSIGLSADGNTAVIGASFYNNRIGAAYVYRRSGSTWKQLGPTLFGTGGVGTPAYGSSVAISADGKTAAVGGPIDGAGAGRLGAVWMYSVSPSGWKLLGTKLVAKDAVDNGSFGQSLALSSNGGVLLVGSSVGGAWLFDRSGSTWTEAAKLGAPTAPGAMFGYSVGLDGAGKVAIAGAPYDGTGATEGAGSSWSFTGSGGHWSGAAKLPASSRSGLDELGWGVAISSDGKTVIVGGPNDGHGVGAAWVSTS